MERAYGRERLFDTGEVVANAEIRVYEAGTPVQPVIYDDDLHPVPTPKPNPFFADADGYWFFYAPNGRYDVRVSGGTPAIPLAYTLGDVNLGLGDCGPAATEFALLPPPDAQDTGDVRYLTDASGGLWVNTGTEWLPVTGFALPTGPVGGFPPPGSLGRLRIATDGVRGIWQDSGSAWFNIFGEVVNVQDFGAVGDGVADDSAAIQAAIDALASTGGGGRVLIPGRTFGVSQPLLLRNGTVLQGTSQVGSVLLALSSFVGDSLVRGYSRDDNTLSNFESVGIYDLGLQAPAVSVTPFAAIDATGWHRSVVSKVRLIGGGFAALNQTAIRISDRNPLGTSFKDCIANRFESIAALFWNRLLFLEEVSFSPSGATVDSNSVEQFTSSSRQGIIFGTTQLGSVVSLALGLLAGDGVAGGGSNVALNAIPPFVEINQLTVLASSPFGDGQGALAGLRRSLLVNTLFALGRAGTEVGSPVLVGGATPEPFVSGAFVGIAAGTVLIAGVNLFSYTLSQASVFVPLGVSILVFPAANFPANFQAVYGFVFGDTLTIFVRMAFAEVLGSTAVFRVLAIL